MIRRQPHAHLDARVTLRAPDRQPVAVWGERIRVVLTAIVFVAALIEVGYVVLVWAPS